MTGPRVSIIVPSFNMCDELAQLLTGATVLNLAAPVTEFLVVDDGSSDRTAEMVLRATETFPIPLRLVRLERNQGRFLARLRGAEVATGETLLFLDARVQLLTNRPLITPDLTERHPVIQGAVDIDVSESLFNRYWDLSHRFLFHRHYRDIRAGFHLTGENFEDYTAGTGILACRRDLFLAAARSFAAAPLSDDRELIRRICDLHPAWVTETLRVGWRPRQRLLPYLLRLWERGPSFVEYHVFRPGTAFRWPIYAGIFMLLALGVIAVGVPHRLGTALAALTALIWLSVVIFARHPLDALRLAPLHFVVVLSFGMGVLRGLLRQGLRRLSGAAP